MDVEEQREYKLGGVTGKGFMPGQSGNPGGRPKGRSLTPILRDKLDEVVDEATGKTRGELVVEGWILAAQEGNVQAIKEILDRTEGKVPDKPPAEGDNFEFDDIEPNDPPQQKDATTA